MTPAIEDYTRHIEAALKYGDDSFTLEDVLEMVRNKQLQFWPGTASVILTEIQEYPRQRVLNVFLAGGNLAEIEAMAPGIEAWAREVEGCTSMLFTGREGWERTFLTRTGWTPVARVFRKPL